MNAMKMPMLEESAKSLVRYFLKSWLFDDCMYRTTNMNEAAQLIYKLDKTFTEKEKGQTSETSFVPSSDSVVTRLSPIMP